MVASFIFSLSIEISLSWFTVSKYFSISKSTTHVPFVQVPHASPWPDGITVRPKPVTVVAEIRVVFQYEYPCDRLLDHSIHDSRYSKRTELVRVRFWYVHPPYRLGFVRLFRICILISFPCTENNLSSSTVIPSMPGAPLFLATSLMASLKFWTLRILSRDSSLLLLF